MNAPIANLDAMAGFSARTGSDVRPETGQLRCPKCKALEVNVHASDIIAANGRVTCSRCGNERTIKNLPAAQPPTSLFPTGQPRTSPSATEGRAKEKSAPLRRRESQNTGDVTRHPNEKLSD